MTRPMKVFRLAIGNLQKVGYAKSMADFARLANITTSERAYVSETGNEKDIARAKEAGEGFFMERYGNKEWERKESFAAKENAVLNEVRALVAGGGNAPSITIEKGESIDHGFHNSIVYYVVIDGERRGTWNRNGTSRWFLMDMTGHRCRSKIQWGMGVDSTLQCITFSRDSDVIINVWKEAAALRSALQAWEDDQLPPVAEQEARKRKRDALNDTKRQAKEMASRLEPHMADLVRLLEKSEDPEAMRLLAIMREDAAPKGG